MYSITMRKFGSIDEILVYSDDYPVSDICALNPKLTMELNVAGSLELTIPPTHMAYDEITRLTTEMIVYRKSVDNINEEIWRGRVILEDTDFQNNRTITCEGELVYLNDTIQPAYEYEQYSLKGIFTAIIDKHNDAYSSSFDQDHRFYVGEFTHTNNTIPYFATNYENTYSCISDLLTNYGGMLRIRHEDDRRYIDYLGGYVDDNKDNLEIRYGENILDISKKYDLTEFATVVVPLGAKLDNSQFDKLDQYLDVSSVNDGSIYIINPQTISLYGRKEAVVRFDDITQPQNLYNRGLDYLNNIQFDGMDIEVNAVDLHYIDLSTKPLNLLDVVHVISKPHGIDRYFPITRMDIPLDSPQDAKISLNTHLSGTKYRTDNPKKKASDKMAYFGSALNRIGSGKMPNN